MRILIRPLLVSGMYASEPATRADLILVNSEQPESQQSIAFWHEMLHLALGTTCTDEEHGWIEAQATALAEAFPEVWRAVKARRETVGVEAPPIPP